MNDTSDSSEADTQDLKLKVRQLAHDLSNSMGILRMAVYYMETAKPEGEKLQTYYGMMNQNLDKMETVLKALRIVADSPSAKGELK
jgi:nitrogen-specific signal transduction histidine kinase